MSRSRSVKRRPPEVEVQELIPRPMLFADEDPTTYEGLRQAFLADLAPGAPYERALAENLVTLEWEAIRHRRMRDNLIRAKARDLAAGVFDRGKLMDCFHPSEECEELAAALVGLNPAEAADAVAALEEHGFSLSEVFAEAYTSVSARVELHERKLAELETRRRRLREEYDRLRAARARPIEDAEIVG